MDKRISKNEELVRELEREKSFLMRKNTEISVEALQVLLINDKYKEEINALNFDILKQSK
jgi:hypothetical protein